jgi:hypothetical protein
MYSAASAAFSCVGREPLERKQKKASLTTGLFPRQYED